MMVTWVPTLLVLTAASLGEYASFEPEPEPARIYGGQLTKTCEFPTTLIHDATKCTATLVHPRVVISAAHCRNTTSFGVGEQGKRPVRSYRTKWCELGTVQSNDAMICVLQEPINDLPVAPIIQGCEVEQVKVGAKVLLAGIGYAQNEPQGSPSQQKRWVETDIKRLVGDVIHIGGGGKGGCNGDSGGPAYLRLDDGTWRTIGATHKGVNGGAHPNCDTGEWKATWKIMNWYEAQLKKHNETDIDLSPCFDDAGQWSPNRECGGYTKDVKGPYGSWARNCGEGMPVVKWSATCGPPFKEEGDESGKDGSGKDGSGEDSSKEDTDKSLDVSISFKSPKKGERFEYGERVKVRVRVKGDDEDKIARVVLYIDGKKHKSDRKAPYKWNLDDLDEGKHKLSIEARDADGDKIGSRKSVRIRVEEEEEESGDDSDDSSNPFPECNARVVSSQSPADLAWLGLGFLGLWGTRRKRRS